MKKDVVSKVWQLIFLLALSIPMSGFAQAIQVKGTVLDASGMTVIGASVLEKGTTNGVITDMDGNFELSVSPKGTLVISYVGFQTQEIAVNNQRNFKITLKEDTEVLDEVVVVGYGTMKKSDMTGAISSVDVDELTKRTTTNPAEALQGKIAGVNIMKSGGNAGAGVSVKIRGVKSFGDNEPLYIIDGFPGDINSVNPVDIQSMEVLKDGAAAAIYGSVAANGVVIITTKNGKKGETHIDFNTYLSMTTVAKRMEFLNAEQYKSTIKQMYINAGREDEIPAYCTTDTGVDTNWQDEMMRNGLSQNYMFSVRGGGETAQYSVSYNHADDKGIFLGNDFRQDNARMKLHMSKYIFDLDANLGFRYTKSHQPTYSLKEVYNISPLVPVYDENEKYGFGLTASQGLPSNNNPMADYYYQDETEKTFSTTANVSLGIKITSWLNFKTSYAYRGKHYRYTLHYPDYISNAQQTHLYPYNSESTYYWEEQTIDNILNFNKEFGKHSLNAMIGSSITSTKNTSNGVAVEGFATRYTVDKNGNLVSTNEPSGFLDPSFDTIDAGKGGTYTGEGTKYEYNRASFFGRINYNFDNRYLIQATMRYDGSSVFGNNNRWGNFWSVGGKWRISEEEFLKDNDVFTNLAIRASYGTVGNQDIDWYASRGFYKAGYNYNNEPGIAPESLNLPDLGWETSKKLNIGLDITLIRKWNLTVDFYNEATSDMLFELPISKVTGLDKVYQNIGSMRNRGVEIGLNGTILQTKGWTWTAYANVTFNQNRVTELSDGKPVEDTYTIIQEGYPLRQFYMVEYAGVDPDTGNPLWYKNATGDETTTNWNECAKRYLGSADPKAYGGFGTRLQWKNFDFSADFNYRLGGKVYASSNRFYLSAGSQGNITPATYLYENAWTEENRYTDVPKYVYGNTSGENNHSSRFLYSGNFLRVKNLQLGYTLPKHLLKKILIDNMRIYISADNIYTFKAKDFVGYDPETYTNGLIAFQYPSTRTFLAGITLGF